MILTFALNIGSAMTNPAWQTIVPELVPRSQVPDAVALNSAAYNLARAVGPALYSLCAGAAGVAIPRSSLHVFVSAAWALLAVVAARDLHQGAIGYGILKGSMGLGAVCGAFYLAHLRRMFSADVIIAASSVTFVLSLVVLAFVHVPIIIILFLIAGGFAWTSTMSTLNVSVQLSGPSWVRARAIGAYQMTLQGGMALGGVIWGFVAERFSTPVSLACAAACLLVTLPLALRFHVLRGGLPDLTPFKHQRPAPEFLFEHDPTDGPVRVSIDYRIRPADHDAFTRAIHQLRDVRMRNGAIRWGVFQDVTDPGHMNETFIVESWIEYLRQRERSRTKFRFVWLAGV